MQTELRASAPDARIGDGIRTRRHDHPVLTINRVDAARTAGDAVCSASWSGAETSSMATIVKVADVFGVEAAELVREIDQLRRDGNASASE